MIPVTRNSEGAPCIQLRLVLGLQGVGGGGGLVGHVDAGGHHAAHRVGHLVHDADVGASQLHHRERLQQVCFVPVCAQKMISQVGISCKMDPCLAGAPL